MTTTYNISVDSEYGEFFVNEREPRIRDDGHTQYCATWCCYSSFGVFGHHWYAMGSPFAEFIRGVGPDYLLSKIGRKVFDERKCVTELRRLVIQSRRDKRITKEEAADALAAIKSLAEEYTGEALSSRLYEDVDLSRCHIEWCDLSCQVYEPSALMFVKKLWPAFVEEVQKTAMADQP